MVADRAVFPEPDGPSIQRRFNSSLTVQQGAYEGRTVRLANLLNKQASILQDILMFSTIETEHSH